MANEVELIRAWCNRIYITRLVSTGGMQRVGLLQEGQIIYSQMS